MTLGSAFSAPRESSARSRLYRSWHAGARMGAAHDWILERVGSLDAPRAERFRRYLIAELRARRTVAGAVAAATAARMAGDVEAALLAAGEETGQLEDVLRALADFFAEEERVLRRLQARLAYPILLVLAASAVAPLPMLVAGRTASYLLAVGALWVGFWFAGGSLITTIGRRYARRAGVLQARFCRVLAMTIEAGFGLDRAVRLAAAAAGDDRLVRHVGRIDDRTLMTQPLSATLERCDALSPALISSLRVAEASGDYRGTLRRLGELYAEGFR